MTSYFLFKNQQLIKFENEVFSIWNPFREQWDEAPDIWTYGDDPGMKEITPADALAFGQALKERIDNFLTPDDKLIQANLMDYYDTRYQRQTISIKRRE